MVALIRNEFNYKQMLIDFVWIFWMISSSLSRFTELREIKKKMVYCARFNYYYQSTVIVMFIYWFLGVFCNCLISSRFRSVIVRHSSSARKLFRKIISLAVINFGWVARKSAYFKSQWTLPMCWTLSDEDRATMCGSQKETQERNDYEFVYKWLINHNLHKIWLTNQ